MHSVDMVVVNRWPPTLSRTRPCEAAMRGGSLGGSVGAGMATTTASFFDFFVDIAGVEGRG